MVIESNHQEGKMSGLVRGVLGAVMLALMLPGPVIADQPNPPPPWADSSQIPPETEGDEIIQVDESGQVKRMVIRAGRPVEVDRGDWVEVAPGVSTRVPGTATPPVRPALSPGSVNTACETSFKDRPELWPSKQQVCGRQVQWQDWAGFFQRFHANLERGCPDTYNENLQDYVLIAGILVGVAPEVGLPAMASAYAAKFASNTAQCVFAAAVDSLDIPSETKSMLKSGYDTVIKLKTLASVINGTTGLPQLSVKEANELLAQMEINLRSAYGALGTGSSTIGSYVARYYPDKIAHGASDLNRTLMQGCRMEEAAQEMRQAQAAGWAALATLRRDMRAAECNEERAVRVLEAKWGSDWQDISESERERDPDFWLQEAAVEEYNDLYRREKAVLALMPQLASRCRSLKNIVDKLAKIKDEHRALCRQLEDDLAERKCDPESHRQAVARLQELEKGNCPKEMKLPDTQHLRESVALLDRMCGPEPRKQGPQQAWKLVSTEINPHKWPSNGKSGDKAQNYYLNQWNISEGGLSHYYEWWQWRSRVSIYRFSGTYQAPPATLTPYQTFTRSVVSNTERKRGSKDYQALWLGYGVTGVNSSGFILKGKCSVGSGAIGNNWVDSAQGDCTMTVPEKPPEEFTIFTFVGGTGHAVRWHYRRQEPVAGYAQAGLPTACGTVKAKCA